MEQRKKRILIVEDERDIAEILKYNVEKQGYEAEVANDGEKGLALALSGTFDLILLDVMLPKVDGFEICRSYRIIKSEMALLPARSFICIGVSFPYIILGLLGIFLFV